MMRSQTPALVGAFGVVLLMAAPPLGVAVCFTAWLMHRSRRAQIRAIEERAARAHIQKLRRERIAAFKSLP